MARLLPDAAGLRRRLCGATREEVLSHIREMVEMTVERLAEEGASLPAATADQEPATGERIVVTVRAPLGDAPHPA